MKIIHCLNSANIGGIERLVIDLAIVQNSAGLEVAVMFDKMEGLFLETLRIQGIPVFHSKIKSGFDFNKNTIRNLRSIFQNFDIVHLHNFSNLRSRAAVNNKTVYTMHGLSKGIRKEHFFKYHFREIIKKYYLNRVNYFIANSEHTLSSAKKHYSLKNIPKKVILNGIPNSDLSNDQNTLNQEFTIGMVSRFIVRKRIERLINAFELFIKNGGKGKLQLIGDGETFDSIQALVNQKQLSEKVEMLGYKMNVHDFYETFDVVAHPSDNEGFGLIALEAYIHGKPILAFSDSGGLVEIIRPLEQENVVDNELQFANRLIEMSTKRSELFLESDRRKKYVIDNFSIERMEREYFLIYQELLK